MKVMDR